MTMHLLPVFINNNSTKKHKPSSNKKLAESKANHAAWVASITGGKKANKKLLDKNWKVKYNENLAVDRSDYVSEGMSGSKTACVKRGVMANLHKESPEIQDAIKDKASRCAPLYSKGGYQYVSDGIDLHDIGKKK